MTDKYKCDTVQELLNQITSFDATELELEVWTVNGHEYVIRDTYVEDGKFCIDIEKLEQRW